jgi:SAM-dependent methyltransferase
VRLLRLFIWEDNKLKTVVISPYAKKYRENRPHPKNYPYFDIVIQELKKYNIKVIQIGISGEPILKGVDEVKFDLKLKDLKKVLEEADTFISVDSFIQHFAAYYNIPGIVIFGQSDPEIFGHKIHINLLKDRKYLRPDQFHIWEFAKFDDDVFVEPNIVIETVKKVLSIDDNMEKLLVNKEMDNKWKPFLLDNNQFNPNGINLHLGCGALYLYDFLNIDIDNDLADIKTNVKNLYMFENNTVDLIIASHILEHFHDEESILVLKEWFRVLKPGGWLVIEMPDIEKCFKLFFNAKTDEELQYALVGVYGRPDWDIYNAHFTGYWPKRLKDRLYSIGFTYIIEKEPKEDNVKFRNMRIDAQK